jgi:hypothetical protein
LSKRMIWDWKIPQKEGDPDVEKQRSRESQS